MMRFKSVLLVTCLCLLPCSVWARDLEEIRRTGELRVLINQSRDSSGLLRGGQPVGSEAVRLKAFLQELNRGEPTAIRLKLLPMPKGELLPALQAGKGDLVASGELLADTRAASGLSMSRPIGKRIGFSWVTATRSASRKLREISDLSGLTVVLPAGSAAAARLQQINATLDQQGLAPIQVDWADASLAVEDVLEMVEVGIYPATVVEAPIAQRWRKVMPKLQALRRIPLGKGEQLHWYFPADALTLQIKADRFLAEYQLPGNLDQRLAQAYRSLYKVHNPFTHVIRQRLEKYRPALQRHARKQDLNWLNLAAMAFKESSLNPGARGPAGAVGLMQVMPQTARSVGVHNVGELNGNIMASARYLARLRDRFFADAGLEERERMGFVLAAYNMGPQRVQRLRKEARKRGYDGDKWFFNVERIAMERMGAGVVSYVNVINKYSLAFADRHPGVISPRVVKN